MTFAEIHKHLDKVVLNFHISLDLRILFQELSNLHFHAEYYGKRDMGVEHKVVENMQVKDKETL